MQWMNGMEGNPVMRTWAVRSVLPERGRGFYTVAVAVAVAAAGVGVGVCLSDRNGWDSGEFGVAG